MSPYLVSDENVRSCDHDRYLTMREGTMGALGTQTRRHMEGLCGSALYLLMDLNMRIVGFVFNHMDLSVWKRI
jgi:hypothetical protein